MSFLARISLRTRIGLLVIVGLLALLTLLGFLGMEALSESVETTLQERLAITQMAGEHIDRDLEQRWLQLEEVAASSALDLEDGDLKPEKQLLRDAFFHQQGFARLILLLGSDGTVLWTEPYHRALIGTTLAHEPHIQKTLQTGKPHASGLVWLDIPEESAPHMAAPVRNADGQVTGLIDVAINPAHSSIGGVIQSIRVGETGYIQIVDEQGAVITATRPWQQFKKSHHSDLFVPMIRDRLPRVARYEVAEEGSLKREVIAFTSLDQVPWGLSVEQDEDEALALAQGLERRLLLSGVISLFVAMLLVWITTGRVLGPVEVLTSAAQRIAAGDLTTAVPPTGEGEIAVLAKSFETMRGKLRASHEEIERWTHELEDKVEHRTRELSVLLKISRILASTVDLDQVIDSVVTQAVALLEPAEAGALFLYDKSLERLVVRSACGFDLKYLSRMELETGEGIPGQVFASARPMLFTGAEDATESLASLSSENRSALHKAMMGFRPVQSAMCAPLASRNRVAGSFHHFISLPRVWDRPAKTCCASVFGDGPRLSPGCAAASAPAPGPAGTGV